MTASISSPPSPTSADIAVVCFLHPLDDTRVYWRQCLSLAKSGYSILLFGRAPAKPPESLLEELPDGSQLVLLPQRDRNSARGHWNNFITFIRFIRWLRASDSKVYHCHEPQALIAALMAGCHRRAKVIYDVHEYQPESFARRFGVFRGLAFRVFFALERWYSRRADIIVTVNQELVERYESFQLKTILLPNYPTDNFEYLPSRTPCRDGQLRMVYQGVIARKRGVFECIDVLRALKDQGIPARLTLIGKTSPAALETALKQYCQDLGLQDLVDFAGYLSQDELREALSQADIGLALLDPTVEHYKKTLPLKFMDYLQAGLPVLVSDLETMAHYVNRYQCGLVLPPGSIDTFVQGNRSFFDPANLGRNLSEKARGCYLECFRWESVEPRFLTLYQNVLKMHPSSQ